MPSGPLDILKSRYRFHEWHRAGRNREQVFVRNYRVSRNDLPYELIKSRTARLSSRRHVNTSTWVPPQTRAVRPSGATGARGPVEVIPQPVVVDAFEYASREGAQDALLELTNQFHRPVALDVRMEEVGDVSIGTPDGAWFAFTRGNLLVRVMSNSATTAPARLAAERLDAALMAKPPDLERSTETAPRDVFGAEPSSRKGALRMLMAEDPVSTDVPPEDQPYIKVFARGGTVEFSETLLFNPEQPDVEIDVFVIQPGGQATHKHYHGPPAQSSEIDRSEAGG